MSGEFCRMDNCSKQIKGAKVKIISTLFGCCTTWTLEALVFREGLIFAKEMGVQRVWIEVEGDANTKMW